ncbi:MAG TPA: hypothetical protein VHL31_09115 [Geminicoccus sp.]|jgi:hypothetical protein|uniref:hypothetical protein n=1 Tax=Geminicoccus sp. TaxID=2024832 RepID=UPI002E32819A|nr:hypothetical protein [Geminicoccus sp.]HEX2526444.1 hypothetical protein [Geminicoccus sp.]
MSRIDLKHARRRDARRFQRVQVHVWHEDADWIERLALILGADDEVSRHLRGEIASILAADDGRPAEDLQSCRPTAMH